MINLPFLNLWGRASLGLDIEVYDAALMYVVEPLHDLFDEAAALLLGEAVRSLGYLGEELATLYKKQEELLIQPWGYKEMPLS
jgi:hypothetical protein